MESGVTRNTTHRGSWGWLGLAASVVVFDVFSEESLSHAFTRGMENKYSRPIVLGVLAVTAAHLLDLMPENIDPLDTLTRYAGARHYAQQCIDERNNKTPR